MTWGKYPILDFAKVSGETCKFCKFESLTVFRRFNHAFDWEAAQAISMPNHSKKTKMKNDCSGFAFVGLPWKDGQAGLILNRKSQI